MGEVRQGLGTMASPAELVAAMTAIGLLQRGFTAAESATETRADAVQAGPSHRDYLLSLASSQVEHGFDLRRPGWPTGTG